MKSPLCISLVCEAVPAYFGYLYYYLTTYRIYLFANHLLI